MNWRMLRFELLGSFLRLVAERRARISPHSALHKLVHADPSVANSTASSAHLSGVSAPTLSPAPAATQPGAADGKNPAAAAAAASPAAGISGRGDGKRRGKLCRSLWWGGADDRACTCGSRGSKSWRGAFHSSWLGGVSPAAARNAAANASAASAAMPLPHAQLVQALRLGQVAVQNHPPLSPLAAVLEPPQERGADEDPIDPLGDVAAHTGGGGCLRLGPAPCPPSLRVLTPGDGLPEHAAASSRTAQARRQFADRRAAVSHAVLSRVPTVIKGALPTQAAALLQREVGLWTAAERGTALGGMRRQAHPVFLLRQQNKANDAAPVDTPLAKKAPPAPPKNLRLPWEAPHGVHDMDADVPVSYLLGSDDSVPVLNKTEFLYHTGTLQQWASGDLADGSRQYLGGDGAVPAASRNSSKLAIDAVAGVLGDLFGVANEGLLREVLELNEGGGAADSTPPTIRLWSGEAGVTAQTHYDHVENFFVQLQGYKRVVLYPPSDAAPLHPFPSLHPSYHQSQVTPRSTSVMDWTAWASAPVFRAAAEAFNASSTSSLEQRSENTKQVAHALSLFGQRIAAGATKNNEHADFLECGAACCAFESARLPSDTEPPLVAQQGGGAAAIKRHYGSQLAQEVVLGPGDTLYIPPMWWHRITALSPSQSVSIVSSSPADVLSSRAGWHPLPVGSVLDNPVARALAAQAYLARFLQLLKPHMDSGSAADAAGAEAQPLVIGGDAEMAAADTAGAALHELRPKPSTSDTGVPPCVSSLAGTENTFAAEAPCARAGRAGDSDSTAATTARAGVSDEAARLLLSRWLPLYARDRATQQGLARVRSGSARGARSAAEQLLRGVPTSSLTCPAGTAADGSLTRRQFRCFRPEGDGSAPSLQVRPLLASDQMLVDSVANVTRILPRLHGVAESVAAWLWYDGPALGGLAPPKPPLDWTAVHAIDAMRSELRGRGPPMSTAAVAGLLGGDRVRFTPGQLRLLAWDYVESIAMWAVGDCSVPAFLKECLWRQDGWFAAGSAVDPTAMMPQ